MAEREADELPKVENEELKEAEEAIELMRLDDKHYLRNKWTLWFYEVKSKIREDNINEISHFDTVEDFWCLFNHIKQPSQLLRKCQYSFLKYGIKPNFDDENNSTGGHWLMQLSSYNPNYFRFLDEYWKNIVLSIIGEVYESSEINGAIVNIQNQETKISVWTNNASTNNKTNIMAIGKKIKEVLGIQDINLFYESYKNTEKNQGSLFKI